MDVTMLTAQEAIVTVTGADDANTPRGGTFTAKTAAYPAAYSVVISGNQLHFVPTAPGTYTVTIDAKSLDGTSLPTAVINFTVSDTPPPDQATHVVLSPATLRTKDIITPPDPGSDTVTGSF